MGKTEKKINLQNSGAFHYINNDLVEKKSIISPTHNTLKIIRKHAPKNELKQENIKSPHWRTELLKILKDILEDNRIEIRKMITLSQVICRFNRNFIRF